MDLFNMRYSIYTVGEHRTETRSNAPGYEGVFLYLNQVHLPKAKFHLMNPYDVRALTIRLILKVNGLV